MRDWYGRRLLAFTVDPLAVAARRRRSPNLDPQEGTLWHAYRRLWASSRKDLPDVDVAQAGGWSSLEALYQDEEVTVEIESGTVTGRMSKRALRMVLEWADQHQGELLEDWARARARRPLKPIPPLS